MKIFRPACSLPALAINAVFSLLMLLSSPEVFAQGYEPDFIIAPEEWYHGPGWQIAVVDVGFDTITWNDGVEKTASLTFTSPTGGTTSGDYNGTFNFVVENGIAWKLEFGNGAYWQADMGKIPSFAIASGGWSEITHPGISISNVGLLQLGWKDGVEKSMTLHYLTDTGGNTSGDYSGTFNFTVTNGIAWKITMGNGAVWAADSGEPQPGVSAPSVEILSPLPNEKLPAGEVMTFSMKVTDRDEGDSVRRIEVYQGRKLLASKTAPSRNAISVIPNGKGKQIFKIVVFDQGGKSGKDSVTSRLQR